MSLFLTAVVLAVAIHLDWHLARSEHHGGLSFGLGAHWVLALPVFALTAWYVHRAWPTRLFRVSVILIVLAAFLAQLVEPLGELALGASLEWTFGTERIAAFVKYMGAGVVAYSAVLQFLRSRAPAVPQTHA